MFQCLNMNRCSIYILMLLSYFTLTILVDNHNCSKILIKSALTERLMFKHYVTTFRCLNIKLKCQKT
jgi:hypothetical protein